MSNFYLQKEVATTLSKSRDVANRNKENNSGEIQMLQKSNIANFLGNFQMLQNSLNSLVISLV